MLKFKKDISKFFDYFDLDPEARAEKFQETLHETVRFSEKIKDQIMNGSEEEREELQVFLDELQEKIEIEKNKLYEKIGISEKDLQAYLKDKNNFSEEEWQAMENMKDYITETTFPETKKPKKIKTGSKKAKWIQS